MNSLFTPEPDCGQFRVRWRGYDRAQVEAFLRQVSADHRRLEERLAHFEEASPGGRPAGAQQNDALIALRTAIADHLHTSVGALRKATSLLSAMTPASLEYETEPEVAHPHNSPVAPRQDDREMVPPSAGGRRLFPTLAFGAGLAAMVLFLYTRAPAAIEVASAPAAVETIRPVAEPPAEPARVVGRSDDLVLTLTALQTCWIRAGIDGNEPFERLLGPDETITLRALDEVVLRVGDAAALSLRINDRSARPLGAVGQVVTLRITPADYATLLADNTDLVTNSPTTRPGG